MSGTGIDITPASSVLVELSKSGLTYRLGRTSIMPGYRHEADQPAQRAAATDFGRSIKSIPAGLRRSSPIVSIPGRDVMYRLTGMGADNEHAVRTLVRMEVEDLASGAEMVHSHQRVYTPDNDAMLLIGVSRLGIIEHYAAALRSVDLRPEAYVPAPIALYACHMMSGDLDYPSAQLVANIGEESTDLIIVTGGDLHAARTLNFGVSNFVEEVARVLGVNREQARETLFTRINMRPGVGGENVSGERSVGAAQDIASQLFAQLNAAMNFAKAQLSSPNLNIGKLVICGSGAAMQGLREFLMSRLRKTVDLLNPLAGVDTSGLDEARLQGVKQFQTALAIPLGLAKIACDGVDKSLSFEAPSAIARKGFLQRTAWLYAGMTMITLTLVYSLFISSGRVEKVDQLAKESEKRLRSYDASHRQLANAQANPQLGVEEHLRALAPINHDVLLAEQRAIELAEAQAPGISAVRIGASLGKLAPSELLITSYDFVHEASEESEQLRPRLVIRFFGERKDRSVQEAYDEFVDTLRASELIVESSVIPSQLNDHPSGRGQTGSISLMLRDAAFRFQVDAQ